MSITMSHGEEFHKLIMHYVEKWIFGDCSYTPPMFLDDMSPYAALSSLAHNRGNFQPIAVGFKAVFFLFC